MKKVLIIAGLLSLSLVCFAQEEKAEITKTPSDKIEAMQTAAGLVKYGYKNYSATALAEAARIIITTAPAHADSETFAMMPAPADEMGKNFNIDPAKLLADAYKFAGKDKTAIALIKQVEKESKASRGASGGPKYTCTSVKANSTDEYRVVFRGGELAEVLVSGDGDTDLDLYIYDVNGNAIDKDDDYTDDCICQWVPAWTGTFVIRVVNRGNVYNQYIIMTN